VARSRDAGHEGFVPLPLTVDLAPGTPVGEFVITRKLGEGGMASVYGAEHPVIGKKAAIKVLAPALSSDQSQVERFIQEARAVNAIGHPNIIDVFAFGTLPDGRAYFVMEWLRGVTLYERLWEKKRLDLDVALDVLDQMCDALEATHEKEIVHRDLKPANVFLVPTRARREAVKLLDFGIAKLAQPDARRGGAPRTLTGQVVGTPEYISPEQARGIAVDGRTDIYALGVISYEMVLGRRPFEADSVVELLQMQLGVQPPSPRAFWPEVPSPLEDLMLGMLEKDPARRPALAEIRRVIHELRGTPEPLELADTGPHPVTAVSPRAHVPTERVLPALPPPRPRAPLWRFVTAGLVVVAAAGGAYQLLRVSRPHPPVGGGPLTPIGVVTPPPLRVVDTTPRTAPTVTPLSRAALLIVRVDAPNAHVFLDGKSMPLDGRVARIDVATPGEHELALSAPGRKKILRPVVVEAGATLELEVPLPHESRAPGKRNDPDYLVDPFRGEAR
jgi:serine/threonine-protein kinase